LGLGYACIQIGTPSDRGPSTTPPVHRQPCSCRVRTTMSSRTGPVPALRSRTGLIYGSAASSKTMSPTSMAGLIRRISTTCGFMRPVPATRRRVPDSAPCSARLPTDGVHPEGSNRTGPGKHAPSSGGVRSSRKQTGRVSPSARVPVHRPSVGRRQGGQSPILIRDGRSELQSKTGKRSFRSARY